MGRVTLDPSGIARQPQTDPALQELEMKEERKRHSVILNINLKKSVFRFMRWALTLINTTM